MLRQLRVLRARVPKGVLLWACLSALFGIGALAAFVGLLAVPEVERARAEQQFQHVTIDPATGSVTGLAQPPTLAEPQPAATPAPPGTASPDAQASTANADASGNAAVPPSAAAVAPEVRDVAIAHAAPLAQRAPTPAMPNTASSNQSLVAPGAKEITERVGELLLPKRGDTNTSPASLYARNFTPKPETKQVSLVLMDAGYNSQTLATLMGFPKETTIAISPYAPNAVQTIAQLHLAGYETWAMLPTMTSGYPQSDPGPLGLISSLPPEENMRRLNGILANTLGAAGVVIAPNEILSSKPQTMAMVTNEVNTRGLYMLTTRGDVALSTLTAKHSELAPILYRADMVLDAGSTQAELQSKLDGVQALLATRQHLVLVAPARPQLLGVLAEWLNKNGWGPGVELAPLSYVYKAAAPAAPTPEKEGEKKAEGEAAGAPKTEAKPEADAAPKKEGH